MPFTRREALTSAGVLVAACSVPFANSMAQEAATPLKPVRRLRRNQFASRTLSRWRRRNARDGMGVRERRRCRRADYEVE